MADSLLDKIAHAITGSVNAQCCHITGGTQAGEIEHNGRMYGGAHGCECRELAKEIVMIVAEWEP